MKRKSFDGMECGIAQALELIGDPWAFLIMRESLFGVQTFDGFHKALGIAKNTLASRLVDLVDNGLLNRVPDPEDGRRVEYVASKSGEDLWVVLLALSQWGNKWAFRDSGPPSFMADRKRKKPVPNLAVRDRSGKKLSLRDVTMVLGPSGSDELARKFATLLR
jgi:DNA-binding HxlR family transcriptional regulator